MDVTDYSNLSLSSVIINFCTFQKYSHLFSKHDKKNRCDKDQIISGGVPIFLLRLKLC